MKQSWTLLEDVPDAPQRCWEEVERKRDEVLRQMIGDELMSELTRQELEDDLRLVAIERFRCPIMWEFVRHVIPALMAALFFGVCLGYGWARAAYTTFVR